MTALPHDVLSEQVQRHISGHRLICAVFVTFQFDPGFFEQEVLPVVLDFPFSHVPCIRLLQLEEALRSVPGGVAVYYDHGGLVAEAQPARLDYRRVPIRHKSGCFHAKNIFALVESVQPEKPDSRERKLVIATMSANLTQSGWWDNVEACHLEEIAEGGATRMRSSLRSFLRRVERLAGPKAREMHGALQQIVEFLKGCEERRQRGYAGALHPHFHDGRVAVADFLQEAAGADLRGLNLEVLSPFVDAAGESTPLQELIDRFEPREVRVLLPRNRKGEATCPEGMYAWLREQEETVASWGKLPAEILQKGRGAGAVERSVHAKVYRFFRASPRRELIFVGSANLTRAAHQAGGNAESGVLVDSRPTQRPDWWLQVEARRPQFADPEEVDLENVAPSGTPLAVRYWWNTGRAEVFWDDTASSPPLEVSAAGIRLFDVQPVPPGEWTDLPSEAAEALQRQLPSSSLLTVTSEGSGPGVLLVQEEGMSHRPSLLYELTAAEILRYWSLLSQEQRIAFVEARGTFLKSPDGGERLAARIRLAETDTLFDRFAGIYHGFGCLERSVRESLREGNEMEAIYRLFGRKYDSLGHLIDRVLRDAECVPGDDQPGDAADEAAGGRPEERDPAADIDAYVTLLCARQLMAELRKEYPEFWDRHTGDVREIENRLSRVAILRQRILERGTEGTTEFLEWFERQFLRRAAMLEVAVP